MEKKKKTLHQRPCPSSLVHEPENAHFFFFFFFLLLLFFFFFFSLFLATNNTTTELQTDGPQHGQGQRRRHGVAKIALPPRVSDLLPQPLGSNNLKKVLLVEKRRPREPSTPSSAKRTPLRHRPPGERHYQAGIAQGLQVLAGQPRDLPGDDGRVRRLHRALPDHGAERAIGVLETFLGGIAALESNGMVYPKVATIKALASSQPATSSVKLVMVRDKVVAMEQQIRNSPPSKQSSRPPT